MSAARRPSVGLDFGTSTTLVGSTRGVVPIGNEGTFPWMPSLVGFADDGAVVMGERAQTLPDGQLVRSIKRTITEHREFVTLDLPNHTMNFEESHWDVDPATFRDQWAAHLRDQNPSRSVEETKGLAPCVRSPAHC